MNQAFAEMHGYTVQELIGRPVIDMYAPEARPELAGHIRQAQATGHQSFESIHLRKDGSTFPVWMDVTAVKDAKGQVLYRVVNVQDISERKTAEEEIKQARDEWERTFDAISDIITIQDLDYHIIRFNQITCRLLEVSPEEITGKHCYELFRGVPEPCEGCPLPHAIQDFKGYSTEIVHEKLKKTFFVSATPIFDDRQVMIGITHIAKDITEQKKLEKQLRQAQKMEAIGTLAGGIAHDFNNILTAILGYADLAQEGLEPGTRTHTDISEVLKGGHRAADLVRQILTFSRQDDQEFQLLRLQYIVKEALKMLRSTLPTTIEIKQNIDKECAAVLANSTQIHQIVMNLCTNAYHAMRDTGGVMEVTLSSLEISPDDAALMLDIPAGSYIQFMVSDNGMGMDQGTVAKIFDPYFTTKKKGEGTGLGLAVVHGIVKSHNGHISVYSEPGKGTTFKIYLPGHETDSKIVDKTEIEDDALPTGTERLLLVDDEETIVVMEKKLLEKLGYKVTILTDSNEALKKFTERPDDFDLIITDMTMPKMDGTELARKILEIRTNIPIILCTGFSANVNREKALAMGIREYVMKPITTKVMARIIRKVLDGQQVEG